MIGLISLAHCADEDMTGVCADRHRTKADFCDKCPSGCPTAAPTTATPTTAVPTTTAPSTTSQEAVTAAQSAEVDAISAVDSAVGNAGDPDVCGRPGSTHQTAPAGSFAVKIDGTRVRVGANCVHNCGALFDKTRDGNRRCGSMLEGAKDWRSTTGSDKGRYLGVDVTFKCVSQLSENLYAKGQRPSSSKEGCGDRRPYHIFCMNFCLICQVVCVIPSVQAAG